MQSIAAYVVAQALIPEPGARRSSASHGPSLVTRARRLVGRVTSTASAADRAEPWLADVVPPLSRYPTSR